METNQVNEVKNKSTKKDKLRKIILIPEIIIIVLLFAISIFSIASSRNGGLAKDPFFGLSFLPVRSDSMKGDGKDNFKRGDLLIAKEVKDVSKLSVGDIITYKVKSGDSYYLETHRIVEIDEFGNIYTQGDNHEMSFVSMFVQDYNILAVYKNHIKGVGGLFLFFEDRTNYAIFILVPLMILLLWNIYGFMKALFDYKRKSMIDKAVASGEISDELKALAIKEYLEKQKAMAEANNQEVANNAPQTETVEEKVQEPEADSAEDEKAE